MNTYCLTLSLIGLLLAATSGCSGPASDPGSKHKGGSSGASHNGKGGSGKGGSDGTGAEANGGESSQVGSAGSTSGEGGGAGDGNGGDGNGGDGNGENGCTEGVPINVVWESGWMDAADNPDTGIQGPWYTYKDARETTTVEPADGDKVTSNCASAHIEPKVTASTDWGAGFACDLNSAGGEAPEKNPVAKELKFLCIDVSIEGGTVDLELPMKGQADDEPPFGIPRLKTGVTRVDLTKLSGTTWGTAQGSFDVSKLISVKFKMNSSGKATDTKVCVKGMSVGL